MSAPSGSAPSGTTDLVDLTVGQIYNVAATAADVSWAGGDVALAQSLQMHLQQFIVAAVKWSEPDGSSGTRPVVSTALGAVRDFVTAFGTTTGPQLQSLGQQASTGDTTAASQLGSMLRAALSSVSG